MTKNFTSNTFLLFLMILTVPVWAQQDPEARKVLDAFSSKYNTLISYSANIQQVLSNAGTGLNERIAGTLAVKGKRYRINMEGQQIANDWNKVYVYLKEVDEITIDYYYPEEGDINPAALFDIYKKGYKYSKLPDEIVNGKLCYIIDLVPASANQQFYRIRLAIEKGSYTLLRYQMWDRSNTEYTFLYTNIKFNAKLPNSLFQFNGTTHPGATIVDLTD